MKKYLIFILGVILIFSLIGCTSIPENTSPTVPTQQVEGNNDTTKAETKQKENAPAVDNSTPAIANVVVDGELKVHYIDVGQADSILIQQGSSSMLVDAGNNEDSETVKNYMSNKGIKKLDFVVGTHPHEDHVGGLDYVINSFQVGKIYMPKRTATTKTFKDVVNAIKSKGLKITAPTPGESFKLGEATCTILAPNGSEYKDVNNESIVIKVTFGSNSFLFTGDAENISENEMLSKGFNVSADLLKVGHHGSNSSTTEGFLNKVNPKYAVISVGKDNSYGHPHKSTMEKLQAKGIKVYRTDENGTIVATSNGKDITFNVKAASYSYNGTGTATSKSNTPSNNIVSKPTTETKTNTSSNENNKTVYFTPSGKSYHYDKNCSSLKRSKTILEGSQQKAVSLSHADPCNICAGGN
ncbi:MBL fold metallo-hydrolase [Clostridium sp. CM028]|nr:MBL fold metallo-hydrolase [Clostridium sp. CM028]WLC63566.1 MBL fold metallo-hydrolase [Clostridium sp. CM028]